MLLVACGGGGNGGGGGGGGGGGTTYTVTVTAGPNGTASANKITGVATGEQITLTITPNLGFELNAIAVTAGGVSVSDNKFTMGTANVVISVTFKTEGTEGLTGGDTETPLALGIMDGVWLQGTMTSGQQWIFYTENRMLGRAYEGRWAEWQLGYWMLNGDKLTIDMNYGNVETVTMNISGDTMTWTDLQWTGGVGSIPMTRMADTGGIVAVGVSPYLVTKLNVGDTLQLSHFVIGGTNPSQSVTWHSNNTDMATVDANGLVTIVGGGWADIFATSTVNPDAFGVSRIDTYDDTWDFIQDVMTDVYNLDLEVGVSEEFGVGVITRGEIEAPLDWDFQAWTFDGIEIEDPASIEVQITKIGIEHIEDNEYVTIYRVTVTVFEEGYFYLYLESGFTGTTVNITATHEYFEVTFKMLLNDEREDYIDVTHVIKGEKAIALDLEEYGLDELDFLGWFTEKTGGVAFDFNTPITEDTTIWGRFEGEDLGGNLGDIKDLFPGDGEGGIVDEIITNGTPLEIGGEWKTADGQTSYFFIFNAFAIAENMTQIGGGTWVGVAIENTNLGLLILVDGETQTVYMTMLEGNTLTLMEFDMEDGEPTGNTIVLTKVV